MTNQISFTLEHVKLHVFDIYTLDMNKFDIYMSNMDKFWYLNV